jgi:hypothetical protein
METEPADAFRSLENLGGSQHRRFGTDVATDVDRTSGLDRLSPLTPAPSAGEFGGHFWNAGTP